MGACKLKRKGSVCAYKKKVGERETALETKGRKSEDQHRPETHTHNRRNRCGEVVTFLSGGRERQIEVGR